MLSYLYLNMVTIINGFYDLDERKYFTRGYILLISTTQICFLDLNCGARRNLLGLRDYYEIFSVVHILFDVEFDVSKV